jgi:hypothetical protein
MEAPVEGAPTMAGGMMTDHDQVVGRWGIEARQLAVLQRTPGQNKECNNDCPVALNAFGVRRWYSATRAFSAGLVLAMGGGSSKVDGKTATWDTYLGVGPTAGMSFLLGKWKHLAVSASPQLDLIFFMPARTRSKTFMANARGLVEGELHLGFMGLAPVSLGVTSGLALSFRSVSSADSVVNPGNTATEWSLGPTGPQSLWDLVTTMYIRFYL